MKRQFWMLQINCNRILKKSWDLSQVDGFFTLVESGSVSPFLFSFELLTLRTLRVWFSLKSGNICVPCFLEIPSLGVTYIVRFNRFDDLALQSPEVRSRGHWSHGNATLFETWQCQLKKGRRIQFAFSEWQKPWKDSNDGPTF